MERYIRFVQTVLRLCVHIVDIYMAIIHYIEYSIHKSFINGSVAGFNNAGMIGSGV